MIQQVSLKTKLIIPSVILVSIIILFGTIITVYQYNEIASLNQLKIKITLGNRISDTLHSLQKERGLSSGYIKDNFNFKKELLKQRKISDAEIQKLFKFLKKHPWVYVAVLNHYY